MLTAVTRSRKGVLVALALAIGASVVGLWFGAYGTRVYAQGTASRIADLRGSWEIQTRSAYYLDTQNPDDTPIFGEGALMMYVSVQNIDVFAGWLGEAADKMTGAISGDGTVHFQVNDGDSRIFSQGKLSLKRDELTLAGTFYAYEDLALTGPTNVSMGSGSFTARKLP